METNNIDSAIKKAVEESSGFYNDYANNAKDRIWQQIQTPEKKRPGLFLIYSLSAACVVLLIISAVLGLMLLNSEKNISYRTGLSCDFPSKATGDMNKQICRIRTEKTEVIVHDTVFVIKKEIVSQPVEIISYVTDTVYIPQIIYKNNEIENDPVVERESDIKTVPEIGTDDPVNGREILISNSNSGKGKKDRKFRFLLGGNTNPVNSGTLALSARF